MKYTLIRTTLIAGYVVSSAYGQKLLSNGSFETAADATFNGNNYNRTTAVDSWTISRPLGAYDVARVNQTYADSASVQVGSLVGSAAMWLSNNGGSLEQRPTTSTFSTLGAGVYTFTVKIGQSSNFINTDAITIEIVDGAGTTLGTANTIESLNPGDDLTTFTVAYTATGSETGYAGVKLTSGASDLNGVYIVDDASLTFVSSVPVSNSQLLVETVSWVSVDTQLGAGGAVEKYWKHRHNQISARGASKAGVLFVGDSITDLMATELSNSTGPWILQDSPTKPTYDATWTSRYKPANYGIAGQVTQNIRWQIANGTYGTESKPEVISLMIGTNNLHQNAIASGSSPAPALNDADNRTDVVVGIQSVVNDLKAWSPTSKVLLHSILPRNHNNADPVSDTLVQNVNSGIQAWAATQENVTYVDVYSDFSDGSGGVKTNLFNADQLHPNTAGYDVWFAKLKPLIEELMPQAGTDYIRNIDLPVQDSTIPKKPSYAAAVGVAGTFGWSTNNGNQTWDENMQSFRGLEKTADAELVFLGDSVTMTWGNVGGQTDVIDRGSSVWNTQNYDQYNALNFGVSGDQTSDVLWRIENGQLDGLGKPKMFVLMIGTNNRMTTASVGGQTLHWNDAPQDGEQIGNGVLRIVQSLQAMYPRTHIVCQSIIRGANESDPERQAAMAANSLVKSAFELDSNPYLHFLDLNESFIDPGSSERAYYSHLTGDNIHPNTAGFGVWASELQPLIDKYVATSGKPNEGAGNAVILDPIAWQSEVEKGTAATVTNFNTIAVGSGQTVNLSPLSGDATYEFLVQAKDVSQASAVLLSESGANIKLEQWNNTGVIGITQGSDVSFEPFYGTSVTSPYNRSAHLVVRVNASQGFSHLFLDGQLVGTINKAHTFSSASAAIANVNGEPLGSSGENVIYGFAAYNSQLTDSEIQQHSRAALGEFLTKVKLTSFPKSLQLYPRDPANVLPVTVPVVGKIIEEGYDSVVVKVFRNGLQHGSELTEILSYTNGEASFNLSPTIIPELAQYDVRLYARRGSNDLVVKTAENVVAGDVYLVQGQSNAYARAWNGSANENLGPFLRSFGTNPIYQFDEDSTKESQRAGHAEGDTAWHAAIADESVDNTDNDHTPGHVGQLGVRVGAELVTNHAVPVAVMTGAHGGKQISFFQRNDANHADTKTNYGRLLWRSQQAGVSSKVRGLVFCQGENDEAIIHGKVAGSQTPAGYNSAFDSLYSDWQEDFTITQHYAIQIRPKCYDWVVPSDTRVRDYQRRWGDVHARLSVFSYNAIAGQLDGDFCHYDYVNGYQAMGSQLANAMGRDLYGMQNTNNIDAPNPKKASFSNVAKTEITIQMRDLDDTLLADAGVEAYFQLEQADGTAIATPTISAVSINQHTLVLTLSAPAPANAARVGFKSHKLEAGGDYWVTNASGVGMLTFSEPVADSLTPLEQWQKSTQGVAPGASLETDTDQDGLNELLEYSLGTNPLADSSSDPSLPIIELDGGAAQLRYQRPQSVTDVNYIAEWSENLTDWFSDSSKLQAEQVIDAGGGIDLIKVNSQNAVSGSARQFLRLRVENSN